MALFKKIKTESRLPVGVMAEKMGKEYEIRLFYDPDPFLDGKEALNFDMIYKPIAKTSIEFLAKLYVFRLAKKYNLVHKAVS